MRKIDHFGFNVKNYGILLIGLFINVLGFVFMIGGGSDDPNSFDEEALFSPVRITVAPFLIAIGYAVIFYSVIKRPGTNSGNEPLKDEAADKSSKSQKQK